MAFNFNWSPPIADTSRARDMLTSALNKSPKPPIIVDDIVVTELNLGSLPPELEILEVGDLGVDRFRGIFSMKYSGDAFLTLKTKVQANPLSTYLSTKSPFASPQPLAAASGLTIPLQITLSDIRLSGFIILVFSRQKGITLVFRNDPLESLKVSSTFDSIPFVRDYLQREIEGQLRVLFMEDLPAIIHCLSLRLWVPDYAEREVDLNSNRLEPTGNGEQVVNPLATPSQIPHDAADWPLDDSEISSFSLEHGPESHGSFSQKNLLRLAALNESHRTLSLFTPSINDAFYRAWAAAAERGDAHNTGGSASFTLASLARQHHSTSLPASVRSPSEAGAPSVSSAPTRPSLGHPTFSSTHSFPATGVGASRPRAHANRKRKHRIVDLRRGPATSGRQDNESVTDSRPSTPISATPTSSSQFAASSASAPREGELITPPDSPEKKARQPAGAEDTPRAHIPKPQTASSQRTHEAMLRTTQGDPGGSTAARLHHPQPRPRTMHAEASASLGEGFAPPEKSPQTQFPYAGAQPGGILEQAWMMKMAAEIARKVKSEHEASRPLEGKGGSSFWGAESEEQEQPPPAYAA